MTSQIVSLCAILQLCAKIKCIVSNNLKGGHRGNIYTYIYMHIYVYKQTALCVFVQGLE
jgi:hypothetical protein